VTLGAVCTRPLTDTGLGPFEGFALANAFGALRPCLLESIDLSENSLYAEAVVELCLSTGNAPLKR
jgi:hypothetical protein